VNLLSRTIDKYGGLDEYLLRTSDEKLASDVGSQLKEQIKEALTEQRSQHRRRSHAQKVSNPLLLVEGDNMPSKWTKRDGLEYF